MELKNVSDFSIEDFVKPIDSYFGKWLHELESELNGQEQPINRFINYLLDADAIYPYGSGRSGLIAEYSGIRFVHADYMVYEIGHPYTPPIGANENRKDALLCISGSGETKKVVNKARKVDEINKTKTDYKIPILGITSNKNSTLGQLSTEVIVIKGRTKRREDDANSLAEKLDPISYLGSQFEYKALGFTELLVNEVAKRKGINEDGMRRKHDNLEV